MEITDGEKVGVERICARATVVAVDRGKVVVTTGTGLYTGNISYPGLVLTDDRVYMGVTGRKFWV